MNGISHVNIKDKTVCRYSSYNLTLLTFRWSYFLHVIFHTNLTKLDPGILIDIILIVTKLSDMKVIVSWFSDKVYYNKICAGENTMYILTQCAVSNQVHYYCSYLSRVYWILTFFICPGFINSHMFVYDLSTIRIRK